MNLPLVPGLKLPTVPTVPGLNGNFNSLYFLKDLILKLPFKPGTVGNFQRKERNNLKNKKLIIAIVASIFIVFVFLFTFRNELLKIMYPKKYQEVVSIYEEEYNVEENLIFAVIKAESNFDPNAVSNRNAIGLMQLMEETAKDVARKNDIEINYNNVKDDLCDVNKNINIGTKYLSTLIEKYKNKELALAAYNAGIGTVDNWIEKGIIKSDGSDIENIPYKETNNYVRKILRDYKIYQELYK